MFLVAAILLAFFVLPSPWDLAAVAFALVVEIGEMLFWIWLSKRYRVQTGREGLVGARAEVVEPCEPDGWVRTQGELWRAHCEAGAAVGDAVRVRELDGLTLVVER